MAGPIPTVSSSWTSAQLGSAVLAAYKLTGNPRYLDAVKRWADLLAEHCDARPGRGTRYSGSPWNRYANPEDVTWGTRQTGGVRSSCSSSTT